MKIALCSDEPYPVHKRLLTLIDSFQHTPTLFGSFLHHTDASWVEATSEAAHAVAEGICQEGIFFCWTGTGSSIVANKVPGIRAALCTDAQTAEGARIWNHANVLVLSNRLVSDDGLKEILNAWFRTPLGTQGEQEVQKLNRLDAQLKLTFKNG